MLKRQRGAVRSVMDMSLFLLLLLSGLLCSASGLWREYHYMNQNMSWSEAQSYCRERFTDLATVDSMNDVNRMINTVNDGYRGSVWIGLKRATQSQWGWSMGDDTYTQYSKWGAGEPNYDGECALFRDNIWCDLICTNQLFFVCFDAIAGYIMVNSLKNWTDAQSYCRQHHTDLATVHNSVEQNQIYTAVGGGVWYWIGLFWDSWSWSDQWSLFFRNWAPGQEFLTSGSGDCVAMSTTDSGKWIKYGCEQQLPFICYGEDKLVKKQIVRLSLSHDGKNDLSDPLIQTAILNEMSEKLESIGLRGYKNISWRMNEDGEVFHVTKPTVISSITCN